MNEKFSTILFELKIPTKSLWVQNEHILFSFSRSKNIFVFEKNTREGDFVKTHTFIF